MISAIELKRCVAGVSILGIVISKLYHKKKPYSIILLEVNKGLEISFYCTILPLSLAVCLWLEGGGKFPLDAKEIV